MSGCGCGGKCGGARALRGFVGLPLCALGLGALPAAFTGAQSDLQTLVAAPISTGDSLLASGNTATALTNYQTAGQNGATVVGPEIDLAGLANATQPFTQQAWTINTALATTTDAPTAQALAKQILLLYQQAVAAATWRPRTAPIRTPSLGTIAARAGCRRARGRPGRGAPLASLHPAEGALMGIEFVFPSDMAAMQAQLSVGRRHRQNSSVTACAALDAANAQAWASWYTTVTAFTAQPLTIAPFSVPWSDDVPASAARLDQLTAYQAQLNAWRAKFSKICPIAGLATSTVADPYGALSSTNVNPTLKWLVVGVGVVGVAVVVTRLTALVPTYRQRERGRQAKRTFEEHRRAARRL